MKLNQLTVDNWHTILGFSLVSLLLFFNIIKIRSSYNYFYRFKQRPAFAFNVSIFEAPCAVIAGYLLGSFIRLVGYTLLSECCLMTLGRSSTLSRLFFGILIAYTLGIQIHKYVLAVLKRFRLYKGSGNFRAQCRKYLLNQIPFLKHIFDVLIKFYVRALLALVCWPLFLISHFEIQYVNKVILLKTGIVLVVLSGTLFLQLFFTKQLGFELWSLPHTVASDNFASKQYFILTNLFYKFMHKKGSIYSILSPFFDVKTYKRPPIGFDYIFFTIFWIYLYIRNAMLHAAGVSDFVDLLDMHLVKNNFQSAAIKVYSHYTSRITQIYFVSTPFIVLFFLVTLLLLYYFATRRSLQKPRTILNNFKEIFA